MTYPPSASLERIRDLHDHAAALLAERGGRPRLALAQDPRAGIATELGAARAAIEELRREVDRERMEHLEALERFREERDRTVAGITADLDAVAGEASRLRKLAEERRATVAALEAELWTLVDELDAERQDREDVVGRLVADAQALTEEHARRLEEQHATLSAIADAQREERDRAEADLQTARTELVSAREERDALRLELGESRERAAEAAERAERQVQRHEAHVTELDGELERLGRVHRAAVQEAQDAVRAATGQLETDRRTAAAELAEARRVATERLTTVTDALDEEREVRTAAEAAHAATGRALKATESARAETARRLSAEHAEHDATRSALAGARRDIDRLEAQQRAYQEALVGAQREIAAAHVGLATSQRQLDDERVQRGALGARLTLEQSERSGLEARILQVEAAGGAALRAERGLRNEIQRDLQGKLSALRDELSEATARLRADLADERSTLQQRVTALEACLQEERAGRAAAEAARDDQDEIRATLDAFTDRIERAGAAAEASAQRCAELEQELARRDAMLRRVSSVAAELREELATARAAVAPDEPTTPRVPTPLVPTPTPTDERTGRFERLKAQARAAGAGESVADAASR